MRNLLLIGYLFLSIAANSQNMSKYVDIYYVTNNNDTVYGKTKAKYLNNLQFTTMPIIDENNKIKKILPFEIKSFSIGNTIFESIEFEDKPCAACSNKAFVKRYIDGPMVLYEYVSIKFAYSSLIFHTYNNKCVRNYYIKRQQDALAILGYRESCDPKIALSIVTQPDNFERFYKYFNDVPDLMKKIQGKVYSRKDIIVIVTEYNDALLRK